MSDTEANIKAKSVLLFSAILAAAVSRKTNVNFFELSFFKEMLLHYGETSSLSKLNKLATSNLYNFKLNLLPEILKFQVQS